MWFYDVLPPRFHKPGAHDCECGLGKRKWVPLLPGRRQYKSSRGRGRSTHQLPTYEQGRIIGELSFDWT